MDHKYKYSVRGNVDSARVVMDSLEEFKNTSGLAPSIPKSIAYFCNVLNSVKLGILNILPFEEGRLPVKYLGVPLVSSRLVIRDCKGLVEKVQKRVKDWRNKFLSFAGRLQLINYVISSIHVYWSMVFILPMSIILDIEQIMRGFLRCQRDMQKGKAKVAWEDVCLPKEEGGLGIRKIEPFNISLFPIHICNILEHKESLWVKWIHTHKLRGKSFWDVPYRGNLAWSWRKLLQIRPLVRKFFWHRLGNGKTTSAWFDNWCENSPLFDQLSPMQIASVGYTLDAKVADLIRNGEWNWPLDWSNKFSNVYCPQLVENLCDKVVWRDRNGKEWDFSVRVAWENLRPRGNVVTWFDLVWFNYCIPKHAFIIWLVFRRKLKTQDLLRQWDVHPLNASSVVVCPLCELVPDSHTHLLFECQYSHQVWSHVCMKAGLNHLACSWDTLISDLTPKATRKSMQIVITKLLLAATVYFLWQERNARLFKEQKRTYTILGETILSIVRLKLFTFRYKKTKNVERFIVAWDLPVSLVNQV